MSLGPLFVKRKNGIQDKEDKVYITRVITGGGLGTTAIVLLTIACLTVVVLLIVFVIVFRKKYEAC